jgi:hypothetical protein
MAEQASSRSSGYAPGGVTKTLIHRVCPRPPIVDASPESGLPLDRFQGALLGLAVGDAVGTTVEFRMLGTYKTVSVEPGRLTASVPR